jgi:Protein of unknown function (DUF3987)
VSAGNGNGNGHGGGEVASWAVATAALPSVSPDPYLLDRGFSPEIIARAGWRVGPLGESRGRYGLADRAAAEARAWFIPYRHANGRVAFERLRLIDEADLERFGGGKYRQPAGRQLALYDPFGVLGIEGPLDAAVLVEGEANAATLEMLDLGYPVLGLPGQASLSEEMAAELGHIPLVVVWVDEHDPGAKRNSARIAERLADAGVAEVRFVSNTASFDANETLLSFGADEARKLIGRLLEQAAPLEADDSASLTLPRGESPWPKPLQDIAFHGIAGDVVRTILPESEADGAALLLQFLVAFGNAAGRGPGFRAEADHHGVNLYLVLVGLTAKGRKGSSWGHIRSLFHQADEEWVKDRIHSGVSSGEGLIDKVRDPIVKSVPEREGKDKRIVGWHDEEVDPGIDDKRLLAMESEFASVLRVAKRDGNTASVMIRQAWDGNRMQTMTRNNPLRATDAHVSIVGHITCHELKRELDGTDQFNGFANRFLYACVNRSKALPDGGSLRPEDLAELADGVRDRLRHASVVQDMARDPSARALWHRVYEELSEGRPGLVGAVTSRAEAQVMRLACIYALLDLSASVGRQHLEAALAVWRYTEESARHIFGDAVGDPLADEVLAALRGAGGAGMSRTELRDRFGRNRAAAQMERALDLLERLRLARRERQATGGAPREQWYVD